MCKSAMTSRGAVFFTNQSCSPEISPYQTWVVQSSTKVVLWLAIKGFIIKSSLVNIRMRWLGLLDYSTTVKSHELGWVQFNLLSTIALSLLLQVVKIFWEGRSFPKGHIVHFLIILIWYKAVKHRAQYREQLSKYYELFDKNRHKVCIT